MAKAKFKIHKGDQVVVIAGRDKGTKGEVLKVLTEESRVLVAGVNQVTKHQKPTQFAGGGIQKKELPVHISNVALADPKTGKPSRVGYKIAKDGQKVRISKASGEVVA